jgi:hypothetical protein
MAAPAWAAGELLTPVDAVLGNELAAFRTPRRSREPDLRRAKIGTLPEGFGFLVPAVEGRAMLACTFVHRKFLGRTPPGKAVFRAFLGGMNREAMLAESDEALIATVRREMSGDSGNEDVQRGCRAGTCAGFALAAGDGAVCRGPQGAHAADCARVAELPGCGWWAMHTTESACRIASGWGGRRRGSWWRRALSEPRDLRFLAANLW